MIAKNLYIHEMKISKMKSDMRITFLLFLSSFFFLGNLMIVHADLKDTGNAQEGQAADEEDFQENKTTNSSFLNHTVVQQNQTSSISCGEEQVDRLLEKWYGILVNRTPTSSELEQWNSRFCNLRNQTENVDRTLYLVADDIVSDLRKAELKVQALYHFLFNRNAEPEGGKFWVQLMESNGISVNNLCQRMIEEARGEDRLALNRVGENPCAQFTYRSSEKRMLGDIRDPYLQAALAWEYPKEEKEDIKPRLISTSLEVISSDEKTSRVQLNANFAMSHTQYKKLVELAKKNSRPKKKGFFTGRLPLGMDNQKTMKNTLILSRDKGDSQRTNDGTQSYQIRYIFSVDEAQTEKLMTKNVPFTIYLGDDTFSFKESLPGDKNQPDQSEGICAQADDIEISRANFNPRLKRLSLSLQSGKDFSFGRKNHWFITNVDENGFQVYYQPGSSKPDPIKSQGWGMLITRKNSLLDINTDYLKEEEYQGLLRGESKRNVPVKVEICPHSEHGVTKTFEVEVESLGSHYNCPECSSDSVNLWHGDKSENASRYNILFVMGGINSQEAQRYLEQMMGDGVFSDNLLGQNQDAFNVYYKLIEEEEGVTQNCEWGNHRFTSNLYDLAASQFDWEKKGVVYFSGENVVWPHAYMGSKIIMSTQCRFRSRTFVHEMGHMFGELEDEYVYERDMDRIPVNNKNCLAPNPEQARECTSECRNSIGSECLSCYEGKENRWSSIPDYDNRIRPGYCKHGSSFIHNSVTIMRTTSINSNWGPINRYYLKQRLQEVTGNNGEVIG
jgi:hypothetical protein